MRRRRRARNGTSGGNGRRRPLPPVPHPLAPQAPDHLTDPCIARAARCQKPARSIDTSPSGRQAKQARLALPVAPLDAEALAELGLGAEAVAIARRWRKAKWIEHALERLERLQLIAVRWDRQRLDDCITVRQPRELGRQVIAATCVPSVRPSLDAVWDGMHAYGAGSFMCGPFLGAYYAGAPSYPIS